MKRNLTQFVTATCNVAVLAAWIALILIAGVTSARADTGVENRIDSRPPAAGSSSIQPEAFGTSALVDALVAASPDAARRNPPASDPVTLGFVRMLDHEPTRTAPPVPGCSEVDPLVAAIVVPIRDGVPAANGIGPLSEARGARQR
ncbi:MAG TPA: hypothetical protein PLM09_14220 [Casimicrobiaceae bacterium]|nr:hypothetical protein [Casimicrobiaceae bacterium]